MHEYSNKPGINFTEICTKLKKPPNTIQLVTHYTTQLSNAYIANLDNKFWNAKFGEFKKFIEMRNSHINQNPEKDSQK